MALTSWSTFVKHFRVKWLRAPPSSLLEPEPVISKNPDTATPIVRETPTTTTTTTTPTTNTAADPTHETITTWGLLTGTIDAGCVTTAPESARVQDEAEPTATE